jgi:hypothetical protein
MKVELHGTRVNIAYSTYYKLPRMAKRGKLFCRVLMSVGIVNLTTYITWTCCRGPLLAHGNYESQWWVSGERGFNDDGDAAILSDDDDNGDGGAMETDWTRPFCDCPDADCALSTLDWIGAFRNGGRPSSRLNKQVNQHKTETGL